jgi:hypothetical protein
MSSLARLFTVVLCATLLASWLLPEDADAQRRRRRRRGRARQPAAQVQQQGPEQRLLVEEFSGPRGDSVRNAVVRALRSGGGVRIVPEDDAREIADRLGLEARSEDGRAAIARETGVAAIIAGRVTSGRRHRVTITVYNGADLSVLAEEEWSSRRAGSLVGAVGDDVGMRLGDALRRAEAPPDSTGPPGGGEEEEEEVEEEETGEEETGEEEEEEEEEVEAPDGSPRPWIDASVGLRFFSRNLSWNDDLFGALRAYELGGAPAIAVSTTWYPGGHFSDGIPAALGIAFDFEHAFAVESTTSDGDRFPTTELAWGIGVRARFRIATVEVLPVVQYGGHVYAIDPAGPGNPRPAIPDVSYRFIRFGAAGRMEVIPKFVVDFSAAYLSVSEAGEIISELYFPNGSAAGIEGGLGAAYNLGGAVWIEVGFDLRRYFYSMNPTPGDLWVAGGAVDQYLGARFGLAIRPR